MKAKLKNLFCYKSVFLEKKILFESQEMKLKYLINNFNKIFISYLF